MKVFIICISTRSFVPYVEKYEDVLSANNIEYNILFWDRSKTYSLKKDGNEYVMGQTISSNKFLKLLPMLRYRSIMKKLIGTQGYTHIMVLTTVPAVLINNTLATKFKGKYILDIRDYSFEKITPYKKIVQKLIDNSNFTAISSMGFLKFLDSSEKIISVHNITNSQRAVATAPDLLNLRMVRIGFIGGVRYFKENVALINCLKNNASIQLYYIGKQNEDCNLIDYCSEHNINNVFFQGQYDNSEKPKLYEEIDMINSIYGSSSLEVTTAIPNRLYDCVLFKKPIITSKGTFLGEVVEQFGLGLVVDVFSDDVLPLLHQYFNKFDSDKFLVNCERFLKIVEEDNEQFLKSIKSFLA